jgi:hypothetical protein
MEDPVSMRSLPARALVVVAVTLASNTLSPRAAADEPSKQQCVAANESAQTLRDAGKLRDARAQLLVCVNAACPGPVRDDCTDRLNQLDKALPTIVFAAKDSGGADVTSVRVTSDGAPVADKLSGSAVAVDPGQHVFAFEAGGYVRTEMSVLVREGDKGRRVSVVLQPAPHTQPAVVPQPTEAPTPASPSATPSVAQPPGPETGTAGGESPPATSAPVAAYVALGVGGVGVVVTTVFGVLALGNKSSLNGSCGSDKKACPSSSQSDINALHTNSILSDVGLGVGIVGLGVGGVLLLLRHGDKGAGSPSDKTGTVYAEPWVGVGALGMRGQF